MAAADQPTAGAAGGGAVHQPAQDALQAARARQTMWGDSSIACELVWTRLTVRSTLDKSKILLRECSGSLQPGFTALMGPSGAGKTTLLNALALRITSAKTEGSLLLNGAPYDRALLKNCSSYVLQEDLLSAHLTVHETLSYAAELMLPRTWTREQRAARVDEVIADMRLERSRHTVVGDALIKGISGGEKKRLSVGIGLLTAPRLLFLDEPTTGLDAANAAMLCTLLAGLSKTRGVTIVATLHQPSSDIVALFDSLMLLARGSIVYHGPFKEAIAFFGARGHPLPPATDPADQFMDVLANSPEEFVAEALAAAAAGGGDADEGQLAPAKSGSIASDKGSDGAAAGADAGGAAFAARAKPGRGRQFVVLLRRNAVEAARAPRAVFIQLAVNIVVGTIFGLYIEKLPATVEGVGLRTKAMLYSSLTQGVYGAMAQVYSFPADRALQLRERAAGMYGCAPYYAARVLVDTAKFLAGPVAFALCCYFTLGLQRLAYKFFIYVGLLLLIVVATMSLSLATAAVARTARVAVVLLPVLLQLSLLFSGYFTPPADGKPAWRWLDYLSYLFYGYSGLVQNELSGLELDCSAEPDAFAEGGGACEAADPYAFVTANGYDEFSIAGCAGMLCAYAAVCHAIGYVALRKLKSSDAGAPAAAAGSAGQRAGLAALLLLLFGGAIGARPITHARAEPRAWGPDTYPDPKDPASACGRGKPSAVCDPDALLGHGGDVADRVEGTLVAVRAGAPPYARRPCGAEPHGFEVAVALMRRMDVPRGLSEAAAARAFAEALFRRWGVGDAACENGVLLLLAAEHRQVYVHAGAGAVAAGLGPAALDEVIAEMRPALRRGDVAAAVEGAAVDVGLVLAGRPPRGGDGGGGDGWGGLLLFLGAVGAAVGYASWGARRERRQFAECRRVLGKLREEQQKLRSKEWSTPRSCPVCLEDLDNRPGDGGDGGGGAAAPLLPGPSAAAAAGARPPMTLECGHTFCEPCLDEWLKAAASCPICRAPVAAAARRAAAPARPPPALAGELLEADLAFRLASAARRFPRHVTPAMARAWADDARRGGGVADWAATREFQLGDPAMRAARAAAGAGGSSRSFGGGSGVGGSGRGGSW